MRNKLEFKGSRGPASRQQRASYQTVGFSLFLKCRYMHDNNVTYTGNNIGLMYFLIHLRVSHLVNQPHLCPTGPRVCLLFSTGCVRNCEIASANFLRFWGQISRYGRSPCEKMAEEWTLKSHEEIFRANVVDETGRAVFESETNAKPRTRWPKNKPLPNTR